MRQGFIATATVLIISAVVLALSTSMILVAIGAGQAALSLSKGEAAFNLAEGCAEDAILWTRTNGSYAGGTLTRPEGSCTVSVVKNANVWTITSAVPAAGYTRTIQVIVTRNSGVILTNWKEI